MAETRHVPSLLRYLTENPRSIELTAVVDPNEDRCALFQEKFGFNSCYRSVDELMEHDPPDCCYVIVSFQYVGSVAAQVLERGTPVFMEKPPGVNSQETARLAELAGRHGVQTLVAFNRRRQPALLSALRWFEEHGGTLQLVNAAKHRVGRTNEPFTTYTSVHAIDWVISVGGPVRSMRTFRPEIPKKSAYNFHTQLLFESGAIGCVSALPDAGTHLEAYELIGSKGSVRVNTHFDYGTPEMHCYQGTRLVHSETFDVDPSRLQVSGFYGETCEFLNALREGRAATPSVIDVLPTMRITEAVQEGLDL